MTFNKIQVSVIKKTVGVCGGQARIRETRIPVWTLVSFWQQGASDEELLKNYPGLNQQDLEVAWLYYEQNTAEIEQIIACDDSNHKIKTVILSKAKDLKEQE